MKAILGLLAICVIYAGVGILLYRQRANHPTSEVWGSDLLVFGLPMLLAAAANALVIKEALPLYRRHGVRAAITCALALLATLVAFWAMMVVALNRYGS